ncbi:hypothetical protein TRVL_10259 [Trypanosoma vivax]|uniref:Matrin-type domain-containing protein n=1 Tax=Trypanosoma vivax (strain Y486) TaxID=1055687 RepID=G0U5K7_TRYVY|nr:hypothetical protein TRVL_10259 [Trypanosoma vivax]CCC51158.1 conserved hypothetical protein [Trypanosoma vivax Y486]
MSSLFDSSIPIVDCGGVRLIGTAPKNLATQYRRRHNERDGRLRFCDYCNVFVSTVPRCWLEHINGVHHMDSIESYYSFVQSHDPALLQSISDDVSRAHFDVYVRNFQSVAGKGSSIPIPPMKSAAVGYPEVVVGGTLPVCQPPQSVTSGVLGVCVIPNNVGFVPVNVCGPLYSPAALPVPSTTVVASSPSVRVGSLLVDPLIRPVGSMDSSTNSTPHDSSATPK